MMAEAANVGLYTAYCQHNEMITLHLFTSSRFLGGATLRMDEGMAGPSSTSPSPPPPPFAMECTNLSKCSMRRTSDNSILYTLYATHTWRGKMHFFAKDQDKREILHLRQLQSSSDTLALTFHNSASGQNDERALEVRTDVETKTYEVCQGAVVFASIRRKENRWGTTKAYEITVAPNVDASMIVAVCVCLFLRRRFRETKISFGGGGGGGGFMSAGGGGGGMGVSAGSNAM